MTTRRTSWPPISGRGNASPGPSAEVAFEDQRLLDHVALEYSSDDELRSAVASFVEDGVRSGETVVLPSEYRALDLRELAGPTRTDPPTAGGTRPTPVSGGPPSEGPASEGPVSEGAVTFLGDLGDLDELRPAAMIAALRNVLDEQFARGANRIRMIARRPPDGTVETQLSGARYEAIVNRAFASTPLSLVCPYDLRRLPPRARRRVEHTHPSVLGALGRHKSGSYLDPAVLLRAYGQVRMPLENTEPTLDVFIDRSGGIPRHAVRTAVGPAQLSAERVGDLVIAFNEVATNALIHGQGSPRVRVWAEEGIAVCTVNDEGIGFDDPLAGYVPPARAAMSDGGMGLWISRQLCNEVDIVPSLAGLCVRLVMHA